MTRIVLAPDKFKGSLPAHEVCARLAEGIASVRPDVEIAIVPVADGGDGLLDVAAAIGFARVDIVASGPLGRLAPCGYAARGDEAVIEMAEICGLARLPGTVRAPLTATSRGLGEAIAAALDDGAERILVGIGGSASTDGGAGMLTALGARITTSTGEQCPEGGGGLLDVADIDLGGLHPRLAEARLTIACDVDNPLTGPTGAAAVYGPQKGAVADDVALLDGALARFADVVAASRGRDERDRPGAGAAGGVGFAALSCLDATLRPGVDVVLDLVGFESALAGADLVVTGEGMLDEQTLHGKAPAGVAAAARARDIPVVAVAGRCALDEERLRAAGIGAAYAIADLAGSPRESFERPGPLLVEVGRRIAASLPGGAR